MVATQNIQIQMWVPQIFSFIDNKKGEIINKIIAICNFLLVDYVLIKGFGWFYGV
jgi:hypothetical protein